MIIVLVVTFMCGVISFSYAYFSLKIDGSSKDIVLSTGDLRLKYTDVSTLSLENALPGDSITKTLIVENIGTKDTSYNIIWKDLINQINYFDLHLDMKCKSYKNYGESNQEEYGECKSFYKAVPYTETKINKDIKRDIEIEVGVTQVYELTITFLNRNYSQNENKNKTFSGEIELEEYIDLSPEEIYCNYDGEMVQGAEYINGQYTYRYMQDGTSDYTTSLWKNINDDGWGVILADKDSTLDVTSKLCTYINNKPVVSMSGMFLNTKTTNVDFSSFNTKNVKTMYYMFSGSSITDLNLNNFDTKNVVNMQDMFSRSKATTIDVSNFDTRNVTSMGAMFFESNVLSLDLSNFDTSNIVSTSYMFRGSAATYLDISSFDTSNVTLMNIMFLNSKATILDLSSFDTSKVTNMGGMFWNSKTNKLDVSSFDTSKVTSMSNMFTGLQVTELYLNNFDTSNVIDMESMFSGSKIRTLNLSSFTLNDNVNLNEMFKNVSATLGYVKNETIASKFNDSSVTGIPNTLKFIVK